MEAKNLRVRRISTGDSTTSKITKVGVLFQAASSVVVVVSRVAAPISPQLEAVI